MEPTSNPVIGLDLHDPAQRAEVERALEAVTGMVAARLVPGFDRPVDELHALVSGDRSPKQVVRDVQSLLYTRFDLSIDHRVISVVQLADDDPIATAGTPPSQRLALTRLSMTQSGEDTSVTVVVTDAQGIEHVGSSAGDVTPVQQRRAVAAATVRAVDDLVQGGAALGLHGVEVVPCSGIEVAMAVIDVRTDRAQMALTGSAVVRRGEMDAVARATLDALNRILRST